MELLVKNKPNHYDTGDVIDIRPDGFEWSTGAQMIEHFTIIKGIPELSELEQELLKIPDEQVKITKSTLKLNKIRSKIIKRREMIEINRRRYNFKNNKVEIK